MSKTTSTFNLSEVGRTNFCYSDEERRLIHEAICSTEEALQRVRAEKRALELQEEALQSDLERYRIGQAPIKRLPDNVLYNIFECCQVGLPVLVPFSTIPRQITISHVCSAWRQLMLDTPAFWRSIFFCPDLQNNIGEVMEVAHAWLSRAKHLPCSVDILIDKNSSWSQDWHKNIVKDFISPHKFKHLDVTFADYHLRDLLQLPDGKLSCIEDLHLCYAEQSNSVTSELFELQKLSSLTSFDLLFESLRGGRRNIGFGVASGDVSRPASTPWPPLIEEMRDICIAYGDVSRFASTPWHQLQHINIRMALPVLFCLRILELSSDVLESCYLRVDEDDSFISSPHSSFREPIHLTQLRKFKVDICFWGTQAGFRPDSVDFFLCLLRCPKLKSLALGLPSRYAPALPGSVILQTLLKMQYLSGMHLEELIIDHAARDLEARPLLVNFPSLKRIVLPETINFTEEVMDELGSGSIAPSLEDLTIKKFPLALGKIFKMIKARSSIGKEDGTQKHKPTPFKSITLYALAAPALMEYNETIQEINQSGVSVNFCLVRSI